ncbi:phosphonoacetaldehyde hydrolase [Dehalobacterium formicoaceticum]|uniref:Phosphonoacetaldehyde hydrolase n=1 Tax=Dehalobacterium formicoaceticum TaxID=51515 RepID=A0ABT1Y119_9FIRM|nr:phosphonoacetaldehyde hydrolase [Dehalobacterium formicoaceticum]MCR6544268.1 phosphonoacetaldehyde hydrolase [Dehalobacterium formicoaceticum]
MSKKIEAVIFDWAGTTVDFGSFAPVQAFIEAFKQFGVTPTVEEVREPMGMPKWNHIETMMKMTRISEEWEKIHGKASTKEDVDTVYAASETSIMGILKDFAEPKPFVLQAIKDLRGRNIKVGSTTGYTDEMMSIVVPKAEENGYKPDFWCTPNAVNNVGRPYPYMIFKNFEALGLTDVSSVIKVGDTVADIKEGRNAGLISVGVIEGSSIMALSEGEFNALSQEEKNREYERVESVYKSCGADYIIKNMSELLPLIDSLEK